MSLYDRSDFEEVIHEMCTWPIDRIVDTVAEDLTFRDYLATCAGNYRNTVDYDECVFKHMEPGKDFDWRHFYENTQIFKEWIWMDYVEFSEEGDRKHIAHWAPYILRALDQRINSVHAKSIQADLDKKKADIEKERSQRIINEFIVDVPLRFKGATTENLSDKFSKLAEGVRKGHSYLLYSNPGVGKTYFSYAVALDLLQEGKTVIRRGLFKILQGISNTALNTRYSADEVIDMNYVKSCDVLIIDEADKDKIDQTGTAFRNFSYLIDRRSEELLPTVVMCNASDKDDLLAKFGPSICDRFSSKEWKAHIIRIDEPSRRAKETA